LRQCRHGVALHARPALHEPAYSVVSALGRAFLAAAITPPTHPTSRGGIAPNEYLRSQKEGTPATFPPPGQCVIAAGWPRPLQVPPFLLSPGTWRLSAPILQRRLNEIGARGAGAKECPFYATASSRWFVLAPLFVPSAQRLNEIVAARQQVQYFIVVSFDRMSSLMKSNLDEVQRLLKDHLQYSL
jgi:hypothetical protein